MNFHNKICILLNWTREYDMYESLINNIPKKELVLLINDISTTEKERKGNTEEIKKILELKKFSYKFFSKEIYKSRYKILISTGEACSQKYNYISLLKYFYGKSLGSFFEKTKIEKFFLKFFGRAFTAGGTKAVPYMQWYPEKILGDFVIKYPQGMDLNLKHFPNVRWKNFFDMFFTIGKLDTELINNKFKNAKCKVIGYKRYEKLNSKEEILNELNYDFKLNKNNKKILWIPTHINYQDEELLNIFSWIENISNLCKEYDVIVRPHPKSIKTNFSIIEKFSKKGFFIDQLSNRKIGNLFKIADLVLADYGGAVFSAIYMEKPLLLLNIDENSKFFQEKKSNSIEFTLRNEISSVYPHTPHSEIRNKCNQVLSEEYKKKIVKIKNKYFGDEKEILSTDKIIKFLLNELSN